MLRSAFRNIFSQKKGDPYRIGEIKLDGKIKANDGWSGDTPMVATQIEEINNDIIQYADKILEILKDWKPSNDTPPGRIILG